jgi:hypothetical protein
MVQFGDDTYGEERVIEELFNSRGRFNWYK